MIVAREEWLISKGLARIGCTRHDHAEAGHAVELRPRRCHAQRRGVSAEFDLPHDSPIEGTRITGKHVGTIDLPMQRLAVIKGRDRLTLVPWRPELMLRCAARRSRSEFTTGRSQ